jgi:hypothetical protein
VLHARANPVHLFRNDGGIIVTKKVDSTAPATLILEFKTPSGEIWGTLTAEAREFKTGSTGFYCSGKIKNPNNDCRYQVGTNVILIGSKE